jgi:hypothetical protein
LLGPTCGHGWSFVPLFELVQGSQGHKFFVKSLMMEG